MHTRYVLVPLLLVGFAGCLLPGYTANEQEGAGASGATSGIGPTAGMAPNGGSDAAGGSNPAGGSGAAAGLNAMAGTGGSGGTDGSAGSAEGGTPNAGGASAGAAGDSAVDCKPTEKRCAGECVAQDDPDYGCSETGCDQSSCPANAATLTCKGGACVAATCDQGQKLCGDQCVSISDPTYGCSATGCDASTCPSPGQSGTLLCSGSSCVIGECGAGTKECDGRCVPLDANYGCADLGRCTACEANEVCDGSPATQCTCIPESPQESCAGVQCGTVKDRCGNDVDCEVSCNSTQVCDANRCVECVMAADCPANGCAVRGCVNNRCVYSAVAANTACPVGGTCSTQFPGVCEHWVNQGAWRIEGVEVTRANYQAFLIAKRGDTSGQSAACAQNISYTPAVGWPPLPNEAQLPMVRADWCDATAYCKWAGRRLCGLIGGGSGANGSTEAPSVGQWANACTGGSASRTYAYGASYVAGRCSDGPTVAATGSFAQCVGAASQLYDMSGNVGEWVDDCNGEYCIVAGARGSFSETELGPEDRHRCNSRWSYPRMSQHDNLGFRCCSSP